jgi:hypothetical protein
MKVMILMAVYKRPAITEIVYKNLKDILPKNYFVLVVGDEPDHEAMCKNYGHQWFNCENLPVGNKLNKALEYSMMFDWDYFIQIGSDDIMSPQIFDLYEPYFKREVDIFGVDNCAFYEDGKTTLFTYNGLSIIGAGRAISRKAVERAAKVVAIKFVTTCTNKDFAYNRNRTYYLPLNIANGYLNTGHATLLGVTSFMLWDEINRGLDTSSMNKLKSVGYEYEVVESDRVIVDIKSEVNITQTKGLDLPIINLPDWSKKYLYE